jgi:hypothetical protein
MTTVYLASPNSPRKNSGFRCACMHVCVCVCVCVSGDGGRGGEKTDKVVALHPGYTLDSSGEL